MNSNSKTKMENFNAVAGDVHNSSTKSWPTNMKELVDPKGPFIPKWNVIFIVSCVFSVLLDPLFLYIPIINDDIKCVSLDNNLKIAALVLRSATDLCYLLNIIFQVYSCSQTLQLYIGELVSCQT
jgi:cyclic nucleotide gated channel